MGQAEDRSSTSAPPDPAGEVFAEPWEARAFALAIALSRGGRFRWEEFRERLIAAIGVAETNPPASGAAYYEAWLVALERIIRDRQILDAAEIDRRVAAIAASPPAPTKALSRGPIRIA